MTLGTGKKKEPPASKKKPKKGNHPDKEGVPSMVGGPGARKEGSDSKARIRGKGSSKVGGWIHGHISLQNPK